MFSCIACIPQDFQPNRARPDGESLFGFSEDGKLTLLSYVTKPGKVVILLSTLHSDNEVVGDPPKPRMILDYNRTKGYIFLSSPFYR